MTEKLPQTPDDDRKTFKLSVPELAIGAVAAVLVALLGSRLGTAGTLAGAAIGSVASALANTFLTAGFERSRDGLKLVVRRRPELHDEDSATDAEQVVLGEVPEIAGVSSPPPGAAASPAASGAAAATAASGAARVRNYRRRQVLGVAAASVLATAGATFVITMGIVTGAEVTTGRSLDGREGATSVGSVGQPVSDASASPTPTPSASASATPAPTTPTPTASATPAPIVSPAPVTTAEVIPTPVATPVATPATESEPTPVQTR